MIIRVKGINKVKARGRVYYYHRATGTRIKAEPGTAAFAAEVALIEREHAETTCRQEDTWGWLAELYRRSPEWQALAPRTRADYQKVFDYLAPLDVMPLAEMTPQQVLEIRDKTNTKRGRRMANYVIAVISLTWNWGIPRGKVPAGNPADRIPKVKKPRGAREVNRPWSDQELAVVLERASPQVRAAVALGAFTGLREADVLRWPWSGYDGAAIEGRNAKTGEPIWMPAHSELRQVLDSLPRVSPVIVVNKWGRPYTESGFRASFFKLIRVLKEEKTIGEGLTFHGLRHTVATKLADAGADDRTIMAITGHTNPQMVRRYTERADKRKRATAAMRLLDGDHSGDS